MIDPFGYSANLFYTEYWTIYEQNENALPWEKWVILNRVVWSSVSALIFYSIYAKFNFHQQPIRLKCPWKKEEKTQIINTIRILSAMGSSISPRDEVALYFLAK